ncbi:MAG: DUF6470 family protein [Bacillota bacterium]|nr:DUF6470 family protein [Bacillota bacterium]
MQLQLDIQQGQIGMDIRPNTFQIQQSLPAMELKPNQPAVLLDIQLAQVQINQREQFDQLGLRYPLSMAKHYASKGQNKLLQGISRRVKEGRMLADIHKPVSVAKLTADRGLVNRTKQLTLEALPRTRPDINFVTADPKLELRQGNINGSFRPGHLTVDSAIGQVQVYLKQKPHVRIYAGKAIDFMV